MEQTSKIQYKIATPDHIPPLQRNFKGPCFLPCTHFFQIPENLYPIKNNHYAIFPNGNQHIGNNYSCKHENSILNVCVLVKN